MKYLVDSNVFRKIGKTKPHRNVSAWLATVDDDDLAISALTEREVAKGIARLALRKPQEAAQTEARTEAVFDAFEGGILPVDRNVAQAWAATWHGAKSTPTTSDLPRRPACTVWCS